MSTQPKDEDDCRELTDEELEAERREVEAMRAEIFSRCKDQDGCPNFLGGTWRFKVPDELKPTKCKGRCLCQENERRPVTLECSFSKDGAITLL